MRRLALGISLTALVTLVLELALTRVFDVILTPNLAYMVITCAVFAFGLVSGIMMYAILRTPAAVQPRPWWLPRLGLTRASR